MEETSGASDVSDPSAAAIETLRSRGWCFGDLDQVKAMILIHSALADDTSTVVNSVESELINTDLKSISAKSLPDPNTLRKSSHLLGPKVLQVAWARDITKSSVEDFTRSLSSRRLLKLGLTDGHSEIAAVEFSLIPSIPNDVVPGTKVRLEGKAIIRNGIVCLNPKVVTLLGGVVQSLHEEWQMNKKYSGFSRSSLRLSQESDGSGPPPFEKLQVGPPKNRLPQQDKSSYYSDVNSKSRGPIARNTEVRAIGRQQNLPLKSNDVDSPYQKNDTDSTLKTDSIDERNQDKPSSSATRPREVIEAVPVQNQAAAQKLLQKMSHQNWDDRRSRGRQYRGKGREEEEPVVFTLDEWEKRKAGAKPSIGGGFSSRDEELARQLQNQFDLEDYHVQKGPQDVDAAENIKMSMFNFQRDDDRDQGMGRGGRGRGRGRGRGQGGGRGRSRGRGGGGGGGGFR